MHIIATIHEAIWLPAIVAGNQAASCNVKKLLSIRLPVTDCLK